MNVINSFLKTYLKNPDSNSSLINADNSIKLYLDNFPFIVYLFIFIYFIISLQIPPLKILLFTFQIHISTSKIHLIQIIDNWIKITALDRTNTVLYKKGKKYDKYSSVYIISLSLSLSFFASAYLFIS